MFSSFTSFVQRIRVLGRCRSATSAIRFAESEVIPRYNIDPSAPSSASPVVSLDVRPPSFEVSDDSYEIFAGGDEIFGGDDETFNDADGDSLEEVVSGETQADLLSPAMSYDHETEDGFALWLAATALFDGKTLGGGEAARFVPVPDVVNAGDEDAVLSDVENLRSVNVVESEDLRAAVEQAVDVVIDRDTLISADAYDVDFPLVLAAMDAFKCEAETEDAVLVECEDLTVNIVEAALPEWQVFVFEYEEPSMDSDDVSRR